MFVRLYDTDPATDIEVPSRFVVCPRCQGHGTHDCWDEGMTGEEMAEQSPSFFKDYMSGVYSVRCTRCDGRRVVESIDRPRVDAGLLARIDQQDAEDGHHQELVAMEARYGS